jgi:glycosyltransferase involved in cell wall biosynthesis
MKNQGVDVILGSLESGNTVDCKIKQPTGIMAIDYYLARKHVIELANHFSPDLINPHFACSYGFAVALSGVWKKIPVLQHCLGTDINISPRKSFLHRWRVVKSLSYCPDIMVDSDCLGKEAVKLYEQTNYHIIPWGADRLAFDLFENKLNRVFQGDRPLRILVPRSHRPVYNNLFILGSLANLVNNGKITITFPDWGSHSRKFIHEAKRLCPNNQIQYYSFMNRTEYNNFLAGFDIYMSASLSDSSPASLIEAMAAGLFPIVADISGIKEWLDNTNGLLFDPNDGQSLVNALEQVLNQSVDFRNIIEKNHQKALNNGQFTQNIKDSIAIMEELINRGR